MEQNATVSQAPNAGEMLPNGLHRPTLDFLFVTLAAIRDKQARRIKSAEDDGRVPAEKLILDVMAVATVSAALETIEHSVAAASPSIVKETLELAAEAHANFAKDRAEKEAIKAMLFDGPMDERDLN